MKNYSRRRDAILRALAATDTHPTAAKVYDLVRKEIPNISLATVYRNLAELSSDGTVLSLSVGDGFERFDGNTAPHLHLHCRACGRIRDVPIAEDSPLHSAEIAGFVPDSRVYVMNGLCADCRKNGEDSTKK